MMDFVLKLTEQEDGDESDEADGDEEGADDEGGDEEEEEGEEGEELGEGAPAGLAPPAPPLAVGAAASLAAFERAQQQHAVSRFKLLLLGIV